MILGLNLSSRNWEFRKSISFFPNSDLPLFDPSFPQTFDQNWNRIRFCGVLRLRNRSKIKGKKYISIIYNLWLISNARQVTIYILNQTSITIIMKSNHINKNFGHLRLRSGQENSHSGSGWKYINNWFMKIS